MLKSEFAMIIRFLHFKNGLTNSTHTQIFLCCHNDLRFKRFDMITSYYVRLY